MHIKKIQLIIFEKMPHKEFSTRFFAKKVDFALLTTKLLPRSGATLHHSQDVRQYKFH
jgi:hypothetical protein